MKIKLFCLMVLMVAVLIVPAAAIDIDVSEAEIAPVGEIWKCTFDGSATGKAVMIKHLDKVNGKWKTSGGEAYGSLEGRISKSGYARGTWKAINPEGTAGVWWGQFKQYTAKGRWLLTDPTMLQRFGGTWECKRQLQPQPVPTVVYGKVFMHGPIVAPVPDDSALVVANSANGGVVAPTKWVPAPNATVDVYCRNPEGTTNKAAHKNTKTNNQGEYKVNFRYKVCPDGSEIVVKARKNKLAGLNKGIVAKHKANIDVYMKRMLLQVKPIAV